MSRLLAIVSAAVFLGTIASCDTAVAGDACEAIGMRGVRPPAARLEIDREAATKVIVHIKRACELIATLEKDHPDQAVSNRLDALGAGLNAKVLAPIYRAHPDLRRLTAAEALPPTPKPKPGTPPSMGGATATYLRWTLSNAQRSLADLPQAMCKGAGEPCVRPLLNLISEIGFAEAPVYVGYPRLFLLGMQEAEKRIAGRTPRSDAEFRKAVSKAGAVEVTPAALKVARAFLTSPAKDTPSRCEVGAFLWTLGGQSKGPDDKEWKTSGPSVSFGSYQCRQLPPDVVRRIDGLSIMIAGEQFAGKQIDWENGKFVLKDRAGAPRR